MHFFSLPPVLLQLASDALPNDMTLALAYLLALPQVSFPSPREDFVNKQKTYTGDFSPINCSLWVSVPSDCSYVLEGLWCQYSESRCYNFG